MRTRAGASTIPSFLQHPPTGLKTIIGKDLCFILLFLALLHTTCQNDISDSEYSTGHVNIRIVKHRQGLMHVTKNSQHINKQSCKLTL